MGASPGRSVLRVQGGKLSILRILVNPLKGLASFYSHPSWRGPSGTTRTDRTMNAMSRPLADRSTVLERGVDVMLQLAGRLGQSAGVQVATPFDQDVSMPPEHADDGARSHLVGPDC